MRTRATTPMTMLIRGGLVVLLLVAAACGGGGDEQATVAEEPVEADTGTPDASTPDPAGAEGGAAVVEVTDSPLGQILVDADGMTLYGFTNDTGATSSCTDECAANWPPLTVEEGFAVGDGLDAATFSTTERDDGTLQLVAGEWPLYRFAADSAPGDTAGQGVGDVWFVVEPSGQLVRGAGGGADGGTEDEAADQAGDQTGDPVGPGADY